MLEYCPLGHALHTRSAVAEGELAAKLPAKQVVQAMQAVALLVVLKLPLAQDAQVRSVVVVPSLVT